MDELDVQMGEAIVAGEAEFYLRLVRLGQVRASFLEQRRIFDMTCAQAAEPVRRFAEVLRTLPAERQDPPA